MSDQQRIDCLKCRYYYVTWDPKFPKGCKAFGFKSHVLPSITVLTSSGNPCLHYDPKQKA
jgi:hypothetical protein